MFAGFNSGPEVNGAENGWRGENDEIDVAGYDLLVGVETGEHRLGRYLVDVVKRQFAFRHVAANQFWRRLQVVLEEVAHRNQLDVLVGGGAVDDSRPAPASSQADEPDTDLVVRSGRVKVLGAHEKRCETGGAGSFDKVATIDGVNAHDRWKLMTTPPGVNSVRESEVIKIGLTKTWQFQFTI